MIANVLSALLSATSTGFAGGWPMTITYFPNVMMIPNAARRATLAPNFLNIESPDLERMTVF
jgi:hypothetical protein